MMFICGGNALTGTMYWEELGVWRCHNDNGDWLWEDWCLFGTATPVLVAGKRLGPKSNVQLVAWSNSV